MSKRKTAKRKSKNTGHGFQLSTFILVVKLNLIGIVNLVKLGVEKSFEVILGWKERIVMIVGKRGGGDGEGLSEKKRARLENKKSKVEAEFRLVVGIGRDGEGREGGKRLGEEEFKAMKKELADRKRALIQIPRFTLNSTAGVSASVFSTPYATRTPLLLSDIEHLVTYAYGGNVLVPPPSRWCSLQKPNRLNGIVVVVVNGVGLTEFVDNEELFGRSMQIFGGESTNRCVVEFLSPGWYGGSVEKEVNDWGLITGKSCGVQERQGGDDGEACDDDPAVFQNVVNQLGSVFPIGGKVKKKGLPEGDSFSRTNIVLTLPQLIQERYPLPIPANAVDKEGGGFVATAENYKAVNSKSRMFSVDCEMCVTKEDPQALTKVAIVDEECNVVFESLVKPEGEITDYLTRWSGITSEMMEGVRVTLRDVQERVKEIVEEYPDCVFVGQSLNCDLKAMRMTHPYVIDTSVIFNLSGVEGRKSSLRDLALNLLDLQIQVGKGNKTPGHCPVEDATAAMKLVRNKLDKGLSFGNAVKNSKYLKQSTRLTLDPSFMGSSFKQNKLDKNVLLVYQRKGIVEEPSCGDLKVEGGDTPVNEDTQETPDITQSEKTSGKHIPSRVVTRHECLTNGETIKFISTRIYENFLSVGFYNVGGNDSDFRKSLVKLDKRVSKLYNNLGGNSLFVVVCSKVGEGGGGGVCSDATRRNNGVAFVRVKSDGGRRE